ncbi:hypothetical protein [Streptomyces sp. NPDC001380]|uniref:hypothetical protein n=1 Tax=Streptomyces sp. NPDC001380 TaxID=3364566 RepID=UPI00368B2F02
MRTGLGVAWISCYAVAPAGSAKDIIATPLHLPVGPVTWGVRIGLLVVPAAACTTAQRWALGLQREDRDTVLHGRETGLIGRLPHGGYVELHEPLSQAELHLLTQHAQYAPINGVTRDGADAADAGRRLPRQLRAGLSRRLHGEDAQLPKPTRQEYRETGSRHEG